MFNKKISARIKKDMAVMSLAYNKYNDEKRSNIDNNLCQRCKKNEATLTYANSVMKETKQKIKEIIGKYKVDINIDKIPKKEYPFYFALCELVNKNHKKILEEIDKI